MKNLLTALFLFAAFAASAQQGIIKGKVTDATTGDEIIGANVVIEGTSIGASSNLSGDYQFSVAPGTYTIKTSYIGYKPFQKAGVVVKAGEVTLLNIVIAEDIEALSEVVVEARADKASENILLMQRKEAALAIESIGARELSARGVSDVKSGLVKMSGVSQVSSRGVYVRGLGDRYNNAYLNGMPLPSPNPNLKVVDLDLFPTAIVRNIDVSKTYNVNQFGDMSGASVNILTKDAADENFLAFGLGINYNTQATFQNFLINKASGGNYLGFAGSQRISPIPVDYQGQYNFEESTQLPFATNFSPESLSAPLDNSYNLQAGKFFNFGNAKLGLTFAGAYKNSYRADEGINNLLNNRQLPDREFYRERYRYETNLTALLGAQYSLHNRHYFNLNYLFINNSNNNFIASQGNTWEENDPSVVDLRRLRNRYLETNLQDIQLSARHELSDRIGLKWGGSYAKALTDEPDRLDLSFTTEEGVTTEGLFSALGTGQNQRYFQLTDEKEAYGFAEGSYSFGSSLKGSENFRYKLYLGYQLKHKQREEAFRSFWLMPAQGFAEGTVSFNALDALFSDANYRAAKYTYLDANADGSSQASAERMIHAAYAYADLNLSQRLKIVPGLRMEYTDQLVAYKRLGTPFRAPFKEADLLEVNILPALNVKYDLTDQHVLRFAASKTLTRPNFRELIPVPFVDELGRSWVGNPLLINSDVYNLDLKYDFYPKAGELLSLGAFYKYIDNPIEQIQDGVNFIRPFNIPFATAYGLELEVSKRASSIFGSSSKLAEGLIFDGNLTLMLTKIATDKAALDADPNIPQQDKNILYSITEDSRMLQGASPYLINASLGYDAPLFNSSEESNIRLTYNRFGKRIAAAGTQGLGDIYELSFGTLDFVIQNTWKSGFGVKLSAKNLLNPHIQQEQNAGPEASLGNRLIQSYRAGVNYGLSFTYRLNFDR